MLWTLLSLPIASLLAFSHVDLLGFNADIDRRTPQALTSLQFMSISCQSTLGRTTWAASLRHWQVRTFQTLSPKSINRRKGRSPALKSYVYVVS